MSQNFFDSRCVGLWAAGIGGEDATEEANGAATGESVNCRFRTRVMESWLPGTESHALRLHDGSVESVAAEAEALEEQEPGEKGEGHRCLRRTVWR